MDVIKSVGTYLNTPVGTVCYNTDKVLTTVLDKENVEGFVSIILRLAAKSGTAMSQDQVLLTYQWLEHIAMYGNQALTNPTFAKNFLQGINRYLAKNTYLTGQALTVADIAAYHALYTLIERLTVLEQESFMNICRWSKHIQAQPRNAGSLKIHLPRQILPHELANRSLDEPIVFHPQPFSYPGYPVIVYL